MNIMQLKVLFAPVAYFPKFEQDAGRIVVQIEIDPLPDGDVGGTIVANLSATSADGAIAAKQVLGQVLHRISHDLLDATVLEARAVPAGGDM